MIGVDFEKEIATDLKYALCDAGLLVTAVRPATIRLVPPLNVTKEECDKAIDILDDTCGFVQPSE